MMIGEDACKKIYKVLGIKLLDLNRTPWILVDKLYIMNNIIFYFPCKDWQKYFITVLMLKKLFQTKTMTFA
jgi:hypothetical protein